MSFDETKNLIQINNSNYKRKMYMLISCATVSLFLTNCDPSNQVNAINKPNSQSNETQKTHIIANKKNEIDINIDRAVRNCGDHFLTTIKSVIQDPRLTCQVLDYNKSNPGRWDGILHLYKMTLRDNNIKRDPLERLSNTHKENLLHFIAAYNAIYSI
jgi:hypothetical protein